MMVITSRPTIASNGFAFARLTILGLVQLGFFFIRSVSAVPVPVPAPLLKSRDLHDDEPEVEGGNLVALYIASLVLVLLGGAFAGLTIAFMGQDNIHLQVLINDGKETPTPAKVATAKNAQKVLNLLNKGKHWVLVTLLLSNVIVNETLPVVLDRCLGGGVAAVVGSTVLIVIFGEILPQSVCVRYGLPIGGLMAFPVLLMMWLMAPIGWPIAKLLDWVLGKHEGTIYKKSGLKTLVALHGTMGDTGERLNADEVTIIRAVLDLKSKEVGAVMTPMVDVFTLSADTVLDEDMMEHILTQGYSRIPIHAPGNAENFVGMLLVKILITYDPEDCMRVRDFPLAALPETRQETSCLDILNYFQVGKSHMAIVSSSPGEDHGALGVVTLEDVIEELIGEEIIDESDVYIDIHKAIRRITPAPKVRYGPRRDSGFDKLESGTNGNNKADDATPQGGDNNSNKRLGSISAMSDANNLSGSPNPKTVTFMMRRGSAGGPEQPGPIPVKAKMDELKQHLKHLGPSNPATNPKSTNSAAVTIKTVGNQTVSQSFPVETFDGHRAAVVYLDPPPEEEPEFDEETPLLGTSADKRISGKGGVRAIRKTYSRSGQSDVQHRLADVPPTIHVDTGSSSASAENLATETSRRSSDSQSAGKSADQLSSGRSRNNTRSGSITESVVETGGIRKVVITTSSGDEDSASHPDVLSPPGSHKGEFRDKDHERMRHVTEEDEEDEDDESHSQVEEGESSKAGEDAVSPTSPTNTAEPSGGKGKKNRRKRRKHK